MFNVKYQLYLILSNLLLISSQLNLYYTDSVSATEKENVLQHNCLRVPVYVNDYDETCEVTSYCMNELSSKFIIGTINFHTKLTFDQLAKQNITSQQLYHWSAPIDLIEDYQFYLNQLSTENNSFLQNKIFYNRTWPRFGLQCQYELHTSPPDHLPIYDIIHDFYKTIIYNPISLTCYEHLQCNYYIPSACLDWTEICDGKIDCLNGGVDEEHYWQLEINQCKDDEYRCHSGQCIPQLFYQSNNFNRDCLDGSDYDSEIPPFFLLEYPQGQPIFMYEDLKCEITPLTGSCAFQRQEILLEAIYSNKNNSILEECWSASRCLLQFMNLNTKFCENLCAKDACINIIFNSCPDILYLPNSPILFGHFYLVYKKIIQQNVTTRNIWHRYICYTMPYYDAFFNMTSKITLNNRTCFFYETVSYLPYLTSIPQTSLSALYREFQKYHLMYNYNSTICNRSNMYQCIDSFKCISIYRLFNNIEDCPYADDENMTVVNNSHIIKQLEKTHFKCQTTNKFISRSLIDDLDCDCGLNEYGLCDDEDANTVISFQIICDGFVELLPDKQNQTDETECQQWQCDNIYTHCDGHWNCLNGEDEINCDSSSKCPHNHHQCVSPTTNQLMCLPIEKFNDGKIDCLGGTDEITLCREKYTTLRSVYFYCINQTSKPCILTLNLCDDDKNCKYGDDEQFCETNRTFNPSSTICGVFSMSLQSDVEKFLCDSEKLAFTKEIPYFKLDGMDKPIGFQAKNTENTILSSSLNIQKSTNQYQSYCHHGLHLHVWLNNHSTNDTCLCPPSYYGSQCQHQNQRISLTIKFRPFSDSYRTLFTIIISLIDEDDHRIIHSYEQISYLSYIQCKNKFNINLLYSTRSKNLTKQYYINIDFYEKVSLVYRGSVLLPVTFPFLPVQRLTFVVDIPQVNDETQNSVKHRCVHGKLVQYPNSSDTATFCKCNSGWSGRYCTIEHTCNCASGSECLGISANNRSICICPIGKFGPRCLLTNPICENNSLCENNGQCIPNDEYLISKQNFVCLCQKGFRGNRCEISETKIILSFDENIVLSQLIFIHFIQVTKKALPARSTTFRTILFEQDSLTIYWSQPFHLVFIELDNKNYYLAVKQTIYNESTTVKRMVNLSDRCPYIREVLNKTIVQWDLIRRIKYYHLPCQISSLNLSCFYDDEHLCLCYDFQQQRLANCLKFEHNMTYNCSGRSICGRNGRCLQDHPDCPTRSVCSCELCSYGGRCQFRANGFEFSLDAILGYHILPNVDLNDQRFIVKMSFGLTIIFLLAGFLNSILSLMTFESKVIREVGCGLYLLGSSITTLLTIIMFGLKFFILLFAQMKKITNRSFLSVQCHSIDFLLRISIYMDQWLNACVAAERAFTVTKGATFNKKKSKRTAKFVIILLVIIIGISCIHDPIHRSLIDEDINNDENSKRTWCITEYGFGLQFYDSILNTIHFFGPFMLNLISTIILITKKSHQQANIQKKRLYKEILIEQFQRNKHILTAPIMLIILAFPRLIITFVSRCLKSSSDSWIFLIGYFISFIPTMLTFIVFVLPSKFYKKEFRKTVTQFRTIIRRHLHLR